MRAILLGIASVVLAAAALPPLTHEMKDTMAQTVVVGVVKGIYERTVDNTRGPAGSRNKEYVIDFQVEHLERGKLRISDAPTPWRGENERDRHRLPEEIRKRFGAPSSGFLGGAGHDMSMFTTSGGSGGGMPPNPMDPRGGGVGVIPGTPIYIHAWQAESRPAGWGGPSGQAKLPDIGRLVRVYLQFDAAPDIDRGRGKLYLLDPNGWDYVDENRNRISDEL